MGVYAAATRNRVEGNFIGTDAYGASPLPNGGLAAVVVISSAGVGNVIGGAGLGAGNVICSDGPALFISATSATLSAGNRIVTGVIFPLL